MNVVSVPKWIRDQPWCKDTVVFSAPDGDLTSDTIPPAEGFFYSTKMAGFGDRDFDFVAVCIEFTPEERERIANGANHIMLSWHGNRMPVFVVPELIDQEMYPLAQVEDSFEDPRHLKDHRNACSWCEARWTLANPLTGEPESIEHATDCAYLLATGGD